jgi:hypothetical protein
MKEVRMEKKTPKPRTIAYPTPSDSKVSLPKKLQEGTTR